ncbi:MAG: carboxymuconolactone decarboxylase family protein [Solirubrobacteraceae bacterium]
MALLPYPDRDTLPTELAQLLGEMPRHAPIEMLAHSPQVAQQFLRLAQAQFTTLELSLYNRELVILTVAAFVGCEYEYSQHIPISAAAGVDPSVRQPIWSSSVHESQLADGDRALLAFVDAVLRSPRIGDSQLVDVREHFSDREIVEMLQLIGFYWGLGRLCTVLDLEIETATDLTSVNAVANLSAAR